MQINRIQNAQIQAFKGTEKKNQHTNSQKSTNRAVLIGLAALAAMNMGIKNAPKAYAAGYPKPGEGICETIGVTSKTGAIKSNATLITLPITEFYFVNAGEEIKIHPNTNINKNQNGTVFAVITSAKSNNSAEGATLGEIIGKIYSTDLAKYNNEQKTAIFNKITDETIQANPELGVYIHNKLGETATSYDKVANLNIYGATKNNLLSMPSTVVYRKQGTAPSDASYSYSSIQYKPVLNKASVIKNSNNLQKGEYSSFSNMIYGQYGKISDEGYRDVVYAVVNHPGNAYYFEKVIGNTDINNILSTGNITDINRALDENTNKTMTGIYLPEVRTLKVQDNSLTISASDKKGIVYQISPAKIKAGQNDRGITLQKKTGTVMQAGDVYTMKDVLQYYSSPDGKGRFASVADGQLKLNTGINYFKPFAYNILEQVVFANIQLFTTPYTDKDGYHPYGVFDVKKGYDVTGKSTNEILRNSAVNLGRMYNFDFKNFAGEELVLPQFNYTIHTGTAAVKQTQETEKTPDPEPTPTPPTPTPPEPTPPEPTPPEPTPPTPTPPEPTPPSPPCDPEPEPEPYVPEPEPTLPETPVPPCDPLPEEPYVEEPEPELP